MNFFFSEISPSPAKAVETVENIWIIMSIMLIFFTEIVFYLINDGFILSYH